MHESLNPNVDMNESRFYHAFVSRSVLMTSEKINWDYEINLTRDQILDNFISAYNSENKIMCNGNIFQASEITELRVYFTTERLENNDRNKIDTIVHSKGKDVTRQFFELSKEKSIQI